MDKDKKSKLVIFGMFLTVIGVMLLNNQAKWSDNDFRVGVIGNQGLILKSISLQRSMVNDLEIDKEVSVWIPNGMGWYQSDKIKKIIDQEQKPNLVNDIFFYNFGFVPDIVVFDNSESWSNNWLIVKKWGWGNYLKYKWAGNKMMIKKENIKSDLTKSNEVLSEIIPRDLADSRLLREDLRITVYNSGQSDGLASFMSRILEWCGFTVVGIDNLSLNVEKCNMSFGENVEGTYGYDILKTQFNNCNIEKNVDLGKGEVELYFGDNYSQMLNYQSYLQVK